MPRFTCILSLVLTFGHLLQIALPLSAAPQVPLSVEQDELPDNSNLIFASLHSLLKSWSQAYAPRGHAAVPVTIKPGSLLYHMGSAGEPPAGMEWFAFDAEHSYLFGGGMKKTPIFGYQTLYTFAATRPLRALYFDGFSAAKVEGMLDLQNVLVYGKADGAEPFEDFERGKLLCEWGKRFGIEGFVREEATFELVWCNFTDGVQLMDSINVTMSSPSNFDARPDMLPEMFLGEYLLDQKYYSRPRRSPFPEKETVYSAHRWWMHYHAATWHHRIPEPRVTLHPSYLVSLYDPSYSSLAHNNKLPVRQHRLLDLSTEDRTSFKAELEQVWTAWRDDDYGHLSSGIDWSAIAEAVVDRNGARIAEMQQLLQNTSSESNITETISHVRLIAFALVMPYIDSVSVLLSSENRISSLASATKHCTVAFTRSFDSPLMKLTLQERRLKRAIEGVLKRICTFSTAVLGDSLALLESGESDSSSDGQVKARQRFAIWGKDVEELMIWLGWAMWQRCPRQCAWDELCYVPMWPSIIGDRDLFGLQGSISNTVGFSEDDMVPRCVNMSSHWM